MTANRHSIFYGVDLWTVLLYVLIVLAAWVSITSASYDEGTADIFSFSHFYMKQLMWIGVAWATALVVVLVDERFYHMFAYPAYFAGLALLLGALLFGREVNGATAWFEFGSFRLQPVEFVKIASLAGNPCNVANPWPGRSVTVEDAASGKRIAAKATDGRVRFKTRRGRTYRLGASEGVGSR